METMVESLRQIKALKQGQEFTRIFVDTTRASKFALTLEFYKFGEIVGKQLPDCYFAVIAKEQVEKIKLAAIAARPGIRCVCFFDSKAAALNWLSKCE